MPNHEALLPDAQARAAAETTFDRNVVVVAGAGTGKTTLLVNRLVHLLMKEPQPAKITQIVALTFTNKAATEMKLRLRNRLLTLRAPATDDAPCEPGAARLEDLRARYGLSADAIAERAREALRDLEKAQIGTLHSFAAHLLRLYPIESGVDPGFAEDDGSRFDEHFAAQWDWWLDAELGPQGARHEVWRRVLTDLGLDQLRTCARALCSELVPLEALRRELEEAQLSDELDEWFATKWERAESLLAAHDRPKRRKAEHLLAAAADVFASLKSAGLDGPAGLPAEARGQLERDLGNDAPAGWTGEDFAEAASLIRVAQTVLTVDAAAMRDLASLLLPLAARVRAAFLDQGWITFDGLLARARGLLRDHPSIRERLKRDYQALLVDEFQDTDPAQYEIVLFLAERAERCAPAWKGVELAPGKLCIVGDPKQSIYAFRRADIEAFEGVVRKIRVSGGDVHELVTNFRSHATVLEAVNAVFDRLFRPREHVQPANVRLAPRPDRPSGLDAPGVEVHLVAADDEDAQDTTRMTRLEAEALAGWIKRDLLARGKLLDAKGRPARLQPGHVALLFRKLTQSQEYLEALRRHDVPYVTDGEKHFYRRQEVVDLVNLLRAVESPHDAIALVGVLRSALGGVTDRELVELQERDALDYRRRNRLTRWDSPRAAVVSRLYERLEELHREAARAPLPEVIGLLFARLPILELAAASLHGEQAVANLFKLRQVAAELADRPHLTLSGFVELMIARLAELPDEAESALAEESLEVVRVLTIHKAKGLEFPVVILPGLHQGTGPAGDPPAIAEDWSTGVLGLSVGSRCSLGAVLVSEKVRIREEAERRRLLYVGMTRAKDRLVLSGGLPARASRGTFLALLEEAAGGPLRAEGDEVWIGPAALRKTVRTLADRTPHARPARLSELRPPTGWADLVARWKARDRAWEEALATPRRSTPSALMQEERGRTGRPATFSTEMAGAGLSRLIGTLAHRLLERWEFDWDLGQIEERVAAVCRIGLPPKWAETAEAVAAELKLLMQTFVGSALYTELRRAIVLGRELPFSIPWAGGSQVMEGTVDLLYRLDGRVWIADYKTDSVEEGGLDRRAAEYRIQAEVYREAVSRALGLTETEFQFIFLRQAKAVRIPSKHAG